MGPEVDWGAERLGCHPGRSQRDRSRRRHGCVVDPAGHPSEHVDELGGRHTRMGLRQRRLESDGHRPLRHLPRDGGCRCDRRDNRQRSGNRGNRASQRHGRPGARIERRGHLHGHRPGHHLGSSETPIEPTDIHLAIDHAWSKGALIVAAAGNAGVGTLDYPARLPEVVSVAAIDESGRRASFSNYGPGLDLSAPGTRIDTLNGGNNQLNNVHSLQGTSFSTPFVSGIAGLLLSAEPGLTNVQLWNILNMTAVQPVGSGYNKDYGWGVVSARNAIAALNQPLISIDSYPTSVSSSSTFGVTWSILGPVGMTVSDTHLVWGTVPGMLRNSTSAQSGQTRQSYTAGGLSIPSGAGSMYFKIVATVNGSLYESSEKLVSLSSVPDFLFVLYQLLASNLLYLALFILVLAGVVAFIPQRRAARARRAVSRPMTLYPPSYYVQSVRTSAPPS